MRDQPPAPEAPESLQLGALPVKVTGMWPAPHTLELGASVRLWARPELGNLLLPSVLKSN